MGFAFSTEADRHFARLITRVTLANPFLPERVRWEREALGLPPAEEMDSWQPGGEEGWNRPHVARLIPMIAAALKQLPQRGTEMMLEPRTPGTETDGMLLRNMVSFYVYNQFAADLDAHLRARQQGRNPSIAFYHRVTEEYSRLLHVNPEKPETRRELALEFALFFQARRAFTTINNTLIGDTPAMARLRAALWQSIFTHDMSRYLRSLYNRMQEYTCLITGESGTGKELAARAIATSQFIPFDPVRLSFTEDHPGIYLPINLPALSPTLIESELFGHLKGSFTGATQDRRGFLEISTTASTVFLDEIGDLDAALQVKLLRVLQNRTFQRVGDWKQRRFEGKLVAATNRNLEREIQQGRFREDLYFRLCSDMIRMPTLREQREERPDAHRTLIRHLAQTMMHPLAESTFEGELLAEEAITWVESKLPKHYAWPGNIRELEQCVRNILIRKTYEPLLGDRGTPQGDTDFWSAAHGYRLTAEQLLSGYCKGVHAETQNWQESARRLGLDHRTVKAYVEGRKG